MLDPEFFRNKVVLAPMMVGSNRTFRRIAHRYGADILGGEMAHSSKLCKRNRRELALISARHEEGHFSAQICGRNFNQLTEAAKVIEDRGASVIDLNAGCPMHFVTQQGSGAALLLSCTRMARIVEALKKAVSLPITVKIRAGYYTKKPRAVQIAKALEEAGVHALTIHARSREQFYSTPANWTHIRSAVEAVKIPIIGNGDIATYEDALRMKKETGCDSVMIGRAALQRPWIFKEIHEEKAFNLGPEDRWKLIEDHAEMIQETFGEKQGLELFRWHAGWYIRWHADQKKFRNRWDEMDLSEPKKRWKLIYEELKRLTLEGPEILPPANLEYSKVEAG